MSISRIPGKDFTPIGDTRPPSVCELSLAFDKQIPPFMAKITSLAMTVLPPIILCSKMKKIPHKFFKSYSTIPAIPLSYLLAAGCKKASSVSGLTPDIEKRIWKNDPRKAVNEKSDLVAQRHFCINFKPVFKDIEGPFEKKQAQLHQHLGEIPTVILQKSDAKETQVGACFGFALVTAKAVKILFGKNVNPSIDSIADILKSKKAKEEAHLFQAADLSRLAQTTFHLPFPLDKPAKKYMEILTGIPGVKKYDLTDNLFFPPPIPYYPTKLDPTGLYSLLRQFESEFIIPTIAENLSSSTGHAVTLFSSDEKDIHFYMDSNKGLFFFNSKQDLAIGAAKKCENEGYSILCEFFTIDSALMEDDGLVSEALKEKRETFFEWIRRILGF